MTTRKRPIRKTGAPVKSRRGTVSQKNGAGKLSNFFVPLFFIFCIFTCFGFLMFISYQTVTASAFFDIKIVDVRGANQISKAEIEKIARSRTDKSGVWHADIEVIKTDIEKNILVKSAVVSRILPDGLRVNINERVPRAVVKTGGSEVWADEDAVILGAANKEEERPPFVLKGWNEERTEKALKENRERVKIYLKMLDEWQNFELAKRVGTVDLTDLQEPQAFVQDSGHSVMISLGRDNYAKRLQKALEVIAGKGNKIEAVTSNGQNVTIKYRVS